MWTTPAYKVLGIDLIRSLASICPAFFAFGVSAGQDGIRDVGSNHVCDLEGHWGYRFFLRSDRSITPSTFSLQVLASAQRGCIFLLPSLADLYAATAIVTGAVLPA